MNHLRVKKKNKSFQTFVNEEYTGILYKSDFGDIGIKPKELEADELDFEITDENVIKIRNIVTDRAFDKAVQYASVTECCEYDVRIKLKRKDFPEYAVSGAVEMMYEYNYINDERYAESYIRSYFKKKSRSLIKKELSMKNIDVPDIDRLLDEVYEDEGVSEDDTIKALLDKKFKGYDLSDEKVKMKAVNLLIRHGFSFDKINNYLT